MRSIKIAAALILDARNHMLVVRKRDTQYFMQPGGKIDFGETPVDALIRELHEELSVRVTTSDLTWMNLYSAPAANEANHLVQAETFLWRVDALRTPSPSAEIEEVAWLDIEGETDLMLAPLTRDYIVPLARELAA